MSKQKIYYSFFGLLLCAGGVLAGILWFDLYQKTTAVTFLNIGQGDAILISQGSNQILIDGGRTGKDLLSRLGRHMPFWDRTVEVVIATHPDADHIGGFASLAATYDIEHFLYTGAESKTEMYTLLKRALERNQVDVLKIFRGGNIQLPQLGNMYIEYPLTPLPEEMAETNAGSIVARFSYGSTEMLFTGDLPHEERLLSQSAHADILKVAHHGSRYSTSALFLDQIKPTEAVISVGKNSYGHPSPDVLARLEERNIIVRRTDKDGDVEYRCTQALGKCIFVP